MNIFAVKILKLVTHRAFTYSTQSSEISEWIDKHVGNDWLQLANKTYQFFRLTSKKKIKSTSLFVDMKCVYISTDFGRINTQCNDVAHIFCSFLFPNSSLLGSTSQKAYRILPCKVDHLKNIHIHSEAIAILVNA